MFFYLFLIVEKPVENFILFPHTCGKVFILEEMQSPKSIIHSLRSFVETLIQMIEVFIWFHYIIPIKIISFSIIGIVVIVVHGVSVGVHG